MEYVYLRLKYIIYLYICILYKICVINVNICKLCHFKVLSPTQIQLILPHSGLSGNPRCGDFRLRHQNESNKTVIITC